MKKVGIYKITSPSGKVYIGQSWDLEERLYRYSCNPERHKTQKKLFSSFLKYGSNNHRMDIICELPSDIAQEVLDHYEVSFWELYKDCGIEMLNIKKPGRGGKHSEESKKKMSESHSGKKLSREHIQNIANGNTGKKRTEDQKAYLSKLALERQIVMSKETKQKISESKKGTISWNKGKKLDEDGRKKLSKSSTCKKKIKQLTSEGELVQEWESIIAATKELKVNHINDVLKNKRKLAGGFIWEYDKN